MEFFISEPSTKTNPGILRAFYAEKTDFTTIETPIANPTDPGDRVIISDPHVPIDSTYGFRECYISQEKSEFDMEGVGDQDGMSTKNSLKAFIPGDEKWVLNFVSQKRDLLILVEKNPCGGSEYYQIGSKCTPAKIVSWKFSTKKMGGNESKGVEVEFGNIQDRPLIYTATIPIAIPD